MSWFGVAVVRHQTEAGGCWFDVSCHFSSSKGVFHEHCLILHKPWNGSHRCPSLCRSHSGGYSEALGTVPILPYLRVWWQQWSFRYRVLISLPTSGVWWWQWSFRYSPHLTPPPGHDIDIDIDIDIDHLSPPSGSDGDSEALGIESPSLPTSKVWWWQSSFRYSPHPTPPPGLVLTVKL